MLTNFKFRKIKADTKSSNQKVKFVKQTQCSTAEPNTKQP